MKYTHATSQCDCDCYQHYSCVSISPRMAQTQLLWRPLGWSMDNNAYVTWTELGGVPAGPRLTALSAVPLTLPPAGSSRCSCSTATRPASGSPSRSASPGSSASSTTTTARRSTPPTCWRRPCWPSATGPTSTRVGSCWCSTCRVGDSCAALTHPLTLRPVVTLGCYMFVCVQVLGRFWRTHRW